MKCDNTMWLSKLILDASDNNWCTNISCTTCGCFPFKKELAKILKSKAVRFSFSHMQPELIEEENQILLDGLRQLGDGNSLGDTKKHSRTIMLLVYICWHNYSDKNSRMKMQESLKDTLSGNILDKMILHHISNTVLDIEYDHWLSPNQVALRRKKKKEEKQRKHLMLMERQRIRSELWHNRYMLTSGLYNDILKKKDKKT
ncbi:hypothetical protein OAI58_05865 [Amylibacter sp.]|nr:hypothetical protein [Amylibacter sp.]